MFHGRATLTISNPIRCILEKILGLDGERLLYEGFMMKCFLEFEQHLKKKIALKGDEAIKNNRYYSKFSKAFSVPSSNIAIKYTAHVRWTTEYSSKTLSPSVTGIDVSIPSIKGKTYVSLKDYTEKACNYVIQKEILGD